MAETKSETKSDIDHVEDEVDLRPLEQCFRRTSTCQLLFLFR